MTSFDTTALAVYLVTGARECAAAGRTVPETVAAAVRGGVRAVQVRAKESSGAAFLDEVLAVGEAIAATPGGERVLLFVNDRIDVALAARASGVRIDGVHLGQSDLPAGIARRVLWPGALIGVTVSNLDEVRRAGPVADYLGLSALFDTPTKPDAPPGLGLDGIRALAAASSLPTVAIGGITAAVLPALRETGVTGAALVSGICAASDPERVSRELLASWRKGRAG